jgi:tetratricopeptide (TPR) repeat protein
VSAAPKQETIDPEALKRPPKPETFVAYGDFSAKEADAATDPNEQEQLRERARHAYQEALKDDPGNVAALKSLARLYAVSNEFDRAKETYAAALKAAPEDASLWFALGMACARNKEWAPAIEYLSHATQLDPENRSYCRYLGFTLARAGRYDESLAMFARYEGEAKANFYLAQMLQHVGQVDRCKMHLQIALAKDPQLTDASQMLVRLNGGPPAAPRPAPKPAVIQQASFTEAAQPEREPLRMLPPPPPMHANTDSAAESSK